MAEQLSCRGAGEGSTVAGENRRPESYNVAGEGMRTSSMILGLRF